MSRALAWVCLILALVAPHLGVPFFLYPVCGFVLCRMALKLQGMHWPEVGVSGSRWRWSQLVLGCVLGSVWGLVNFLVLGPWIVWLTGLRPDFSDFVFVQRGVGSLLVAWSAAWLIGGFYEEWVFRGVLHASLRRMTMPGRAGAVMAFLATSSAFALYHVQLGIFGVINAALLCLPLGLLQWRYRQQLASLVGFHACSDMVALLLIHLGRMPG